jgi:hypothetical protein
MKIKITAIRSKDVNWTGGVFKKYEVKTDKTGEEIIEMQLGGKRNEKVKKDDVIEGYIDNTFYMGKNGKVDKKILKGVNAEYVLTLLKKLAPGIETTANEVTSDTTPAPSNDGFDTPVDDGFGTPSMPTPEVDNDVAW